jgi:hypothetical protein
MVPPPIALDNRPLVESGFWKRLMKRGIRLGKNPNANITKMLDIRKASVPFSSLGGAIVSVDTDSAIMVLPMDNKSAIDRRRSVRGNVSCPRRAGMGATLMELMYLHLQESSTIQSPLVWVHMYVPAGT